MNSCPIKCFCTDQVCSVDRVTYCCGYGDAHCAGARVVNLVFCEVGNGGSGPLILLGIFVWCLDNPGMSFCTRTPYEDNAITNAVEMYESISGGLNFTASNNDRNMRVCNMERYELIHQFQFPWPVNVIVSCSGTLFMVFLFLRCQLKRSMLSKTEIVVPFFALNLWCVSHFSCSSEEEHLPRAFVLFCNM